MGSFSVSSTSELGPDRWGGRSWSSFKQFYEDIYGAHLVESYVVGNCEAQLVVADQTEGDWSDAATPTLGISSVVSGAVEGAFNLGAGRFRAQMQLNEFVLIPPGTEAEIVRHGDHRVEAIAVPYAKLLELSGDDCGLPPNGDFGPMHCRSNISPAVIQLSAALLRGARSCEPYGRLASDGRILQLVAALLELSDGQPARAVGGLSPSQLRRCLDALAQETPLRISLQDLAGLTGLSASHVSRAFKVSTGATPHAWATRHRLEQAKVALTGSAKVAEIAAACGFASQQHFTTAFKKATGATPAAWRREWRR